MPRPHFSLATAWPERILLDYVKKPDDTFAWKLKEKINHPAGTVYDLELVSQTWQGIKWEHQLQVYVPTGVKPTETIVLWNQGGKASPTTILVGMEMAKKANAPVAFLFGIPNQPLFEGKLKEDALIAETFVRYLKTGDSDWPLLFPMVKSLTKAMDALQAFAMREWNFMIRFFVVTGGSKRGWTTWLTGAGDPRVKAIAPLVIDTLNMQKQLPHQLKSYGRYSEMIDDYVEARSGAAAENGAGDEAVEHGRSVGVPRQDHDAYDDYQSAPMIRTGRWTHSISTGTTSSRRSWVEYVPNAGHDLKQNKTDFTRVANTLGAFARHQIHGVKMPKLTWKHDDADGKARLLIQSDPIPKAARLWVADAEKRDFRKSAGRSKRRPSARTRLSARWICQPPAIAFSTARWNIRSMGSRST